MGFVQLTSLVIAPKAPDWFGYLLGHVSSDQLVAYTSAASTGTKMPRTNWKDISRYRIALPMESIAIVFDNVVRSFIERIHANIYENRTLAVIRDTLLPKLISGELRVPDAEKFLEEAGV